MANLGELTVGLKVDPAAITNMTKQIQQGADSASSSVDGVGKSATASGKSLDRMGNEGSEAGKKTGDAMDGATKKTDSFGVSLKNAL